MSTVVLAPTQISSILLCGIPDSQSLVACTRTKIPRCPAVSTYGFSIADFKWEHFEKYFAALSVFQMHTNLS